MATAPQSDHVHMSAAYSLGVLRGDGIGPEIVPAPISVADAALRTVNGAPIRRAERHGDGGLRDAARAAERAAETSVGAGISTPDLGGTASTGTFTAAAVRVLQDM